MKIHTATKKDHRCDLCGRRIPIGAKYWSNESGGRREHTNCDLYEKEPLLDLGYNQNRPKPKKSIFKQTKEDARRQRAAKALYDETMTTP